MEQGRAKPSQCHHRMKSCGQNQTDQRQRHKDQHGTSRAEYIPTQHHIELMTEPAPRAGYIEFLFPSQQDQMLQIKQGGPAQDADKDPTEANSQALTLPGECGNTESNQPDCTEVGGTTKEEIHEACHDGTDSADKIDRGLGNRRVFTKCPSGHIPQIEREQG